MSSRILLTGATGYVGGRLIRPLEESDHVLRCMARRPGYLAPKLSSGTELVEADALDPGSVDRAMEGVDVAYYLIHSMGEDEGFEDKERRAAENFARAARNAGVQRIVYLGGLGSGDLSAHLDSRQTVGRILRESGVPTVEFRASIIIGSGSLSFELVRALVNKLPVMVTPSWVRTPTQPIAIEDVVDYLLQALDVELEGSSKIFEIGGADVVSYEEIMREYARQRGLRRWMIPVPVLTPRLSSLWLALVTPVFARIGRKLVDSIRNETVVRDPGALERFDVRPRGVAAAIRRALRHEDQEMAETRWSDALSSSGDSGGWGGVRFGSRRVDSRVVRVEVPPPAAFEPIRRIGGDAGWYFADSLWRIRGFLDLLVGGVGLRRGRPHPEDLSPGDTLDFWRVERYEPPHLLRLFAEMKLPGRAWLQFEVDGDEDVSTIRQTAVFDPVGVGGLLYWYGVFPLHALVFSGMLRGIRRAAERNDRRVAAGGSP